MSLSVAASARIPVCRSHSNYLKLSLSISRCYMSLVNPFLFLVRITQSGMVEVLESRMRSALGQMV